jgi:hypothetical protein
MMILGRRSMAMEATVVRVWVSGDGWNVRGVGVWVVEEERTRVGLRLVVRRRERGLWFKFRERGEEWRWRRVVVVVVGVRRRGVRRRAAWEVIRFRGAIFFSWFLRRVKSLETFGCDLCMSIKAVAKMYSDKY